jgi:TRAP-type C4-dicarboxylate transport system substrate-binding protein
MSNIEYTNDGRRKVRWIIAHFPVELFRRTAKAFVEKIEKACPGQFDIEILTLGDYIEKYENLYTKEELEVWNTTTPTIKNLENSFRTIKTNHEVKELSTFIEINDKWSLFFDAMRDGKFEMSQTQVSIVGAHLYKNFHAIDLPFIFQGHDHVSKVLDGEVGDRLGDMVGDSTGIRGLSFTYSGGYRIIGSTDGITKLSDLNDKKFITGTATSARLFNSAGVDYISRKHATIDDIGDMNEKGGAIETTYLRFEGKNILKTNHSIFMTSVLASDKFLATLTDQQRKIWKSAAKAVAKLERLWSVEDAQKYEDEAKGRGINIVEASDEDKQVLKSAAEKVYQKENLEKIGIDISLVNEIIEIGKQ